MPRARSINQDQRQAAAASENGSGCLSVYWMPPLAALFIACMLAVFALRAPLHTSALNDVVTVATSQPSNPQAGDLSLPIVTPVLPVADNTNLVVPSSGVDTTAANPAPRTSNNPFF